MERIYNTDAQVVADIVAHHVAANVIPVAPPSGTAGVPTSVPVLVRPDGDGGIVTQSLKALIEEYRTAPERRVGVATMLTLESLIDHTNRFKDADTAVFADNRRDTPCLLTVFDYHRIGAEGAPRFGTHRASYQFPLSDEWQAWAKFDGATMDQSEFAEFLEDRIGDVEVPPELGGDDEPTQKLAALLARLGGRLAGPATLMDLSRGLKVTADERVHQALNLSSGESQIQYACEHRDEQGAPLKVPNLFLITIPVFNSGDVFRIPVRLRYRVRGGAISWSYHLHRTDQVFDAAFTDACRMVIEATELPLFVGKPEAR